MIHTMRLGACALLVIAAAVLVPQPSRAQTRTWDELKAEVQTRADRQRYPLTGMLADDVREILGNLKSLDRDEWARAWSAMGDRYADRARAAEKANAAEAREDYLAAWRYHGFGAWPTQNSPEKKAAYRKSVEDFQNYGRLQEPPIEVVHIPFEGSEIVGYLQLPKGGAAAPVILNIGGLDSYKEYTAERYGPVLMAAGIGYMSLDIPGTGQAPLKYDVASDRMYSRVIDYLLTRPEVDRARIGVQGVSAGGYWSAKLAYTEAKRLKAAVVWAGPVHEAFQRDWLKPSMQTREYLFDYAPARMSVYAAETEDDYFTAAARMSLVTQGLLDQPTPTTLLVNGAKDSQVSINDLYMMQRTGTPKTAWVNPAGGHLGRSADWSDERIYRQIIVPWLQTSLKSH